MLLKVIHANKLYSHGHKKQVPYSILGHSNFQRNSPIFPYLETFLKPSVNKPFLNVK